jgi:hypothetical protein
MTEQLRGPFEKFEPELCGGAVTVAFSEKASPRTFQTALAY